VLLVAESHGRFRQHARLVRPPRHAGTPTPPGARGERRASGARRRTNVLWRRLGARRRPRGASRRERSRRAGPRPVHGTTEAIRRNF
jgi:hypothetical protein